MAPVVQVDSVKRAMEPFEKASVPVSLCEGWGDPAKSIVQHAEELDADAVCVAGRKRSPAGKMLFESVSQLVILNTDRPELLCSSLRQKE